MYTEKWRQGAPAQPVAGNLNMIGAPIPSPQGPGLRFSPAVVTALFALIVALIVLAYANGSLHLIKAEEAAERARDIRERSKPVPAGAGGTAPVAPAPSGPTPPHQAVR